MPDLNVPRANASGFVLGNDNLYVLGGQFKETSPNNLYSNCLMIEKLNLRNHLHNKFDLLEIQIPACLF
mgnify:FL=1